MMGGEFRLFQLGTGFSEVWRAERDGTGQIQLTDLKEEVSYILSPRWSPDGKWLVFDAYSLGNSDIYRVSSEGGSANRLTSDPAIDSSPELLAR